MFGIKGIISLYLDRTEKSYRVETNEQDTHYTFVTLHNMGTRYQVIFTTMMSHELIQLSAKNFVTSHLIISFSKTNTMYQKKAKSIIVPKKL